VVASLLYENSLHKALFSTVFYALLLLVFYYLHPGAQITDKIELIKISAISLITVNAIAALLPKLMNRESTGRDVSLANMMIPIFSIAKRSLRRRKIRFLLTLTSVLLLVASFISLTSFTSGYGLSFTKSGNTIDKEGIMIRTPDPPPSKALAPFSGGTGVAGPLPLDESLLDWYEIIEEVVDVVPRYENYAQRQYRESNTPIAYIERTPIFGMVGIDPMYEAEVNHLDSAIIEGRYLSDTPGEVLISAELAENFQKTIGDQFTLTSQEKTHELTIVGILDDDILEELTDIDGYSIMPQKIIEFERIEVDGPDLVTEALAPCTPDETIWVNIETGNNMSALWLLRINLVLDDEVDILGFAQSTALNRGFRAWASTYSGVYLAELTGYFEGKGLPIVIPWVIVVLNVVVTMMNAYYERRHDVMIYSSIGMNPRHISSIFLAEAAVIGVVGGCLGYLVGLGAYKIIYILTPALQVKQKVSAFWSLAAIGISMMAVVVGGLSALKNSTSITPSLRRRWKIDEKQDSTDETKIMLPVQVYEEEIEEYIDFLWTKLDDAKKGKTMAVRIPQKKQVAEKSWEYTFIYSSANPQISPLYTRNRLIVEKIEGKTYTTILYTKGDSDSVKQAGSLLRQIGLEWSLQREEGNH
jgi:ABC-type lipoprotein release transport system permease subunit